MKSASSGTNEGGSRLIERSDELTAIEATLDALASGAGGRTVVVRGSPGIGKTSLLREARSMAESRGLTTAIARAEPLDRDLPLSLIKRLLWRRVRQVEPGLAYRGSAGPAAALFTEASDGASETGLDAMVQALGWLLINLAEIEPMVFLLDDVHDADRPSLAVLDRVAASADGLALATISCTRVATAPSLELAALTARVRREGGLIEPTALTRDGVGAMLDRELASTPNAATTDACFSSSGGNPEMVRAIASSLRHADGSGEASEVLAPDALAELMVGRLRLLASSEQAVAEAVAVLEGHATLDRIAQLTEVDRSGVEEALSRLAAADLARPDLPPRLAHPTIATAITEGMPAGRSSFLHSRAADLLAAEGFGADVQAVHLLVAEPQGSPERAAVLAEAGQASMATSPDAAERLLKRALAEPPAPETAPSLLRALGEAELRSGKDDGIAHLREALRLVADPAERVQFARTLSSALTDRSRWAEATAVLAKARADLSAEDSELDVELKALELINAWLMGESAGRDERLDSIESSFDSAPPAVRAKAMATLTWSAATEAKDAARVRDLAIRATELIRRDGASDPLSVILLLGSLVATDERDAAGVAEEALMKWVGDQPDAATAAGLAAGVRTVQRWRVGHVVEAAALGDELESIEPWMVATIGAYALALADCGRIEEARSLCAAYDAEQDLLGVELMHFALARIDAWEGRYPEAAEGFERAGRTQLGHGIHGPNLISWRSQAGLNAMRAGDLTRARLLIEEEVELAEAYGAPGSIGIALVAQGTLEGGEAGRALIEAGIAALEPAGLEQELAVAKLELGCSVRRDGRPAAAREHLREALAIADRIGAKPLAELCRAELRVAGGRPRRSALEGPASLTASEERIARLAAAGRRNREIADELVLSVKTVEMHLRAAYRKLGISSRKELAASLDGDE